MTKFVTVIVSLFVSISSFASLESDYDALKDSGIDFEVIGVICEEVARMQMARVYQEPQYTVVTGIAYGDAKRTIGELDVIVFENHNQNVVKVSEVKCWKDMSAGLHKAREQRKRFLENLRSNKSLIFRSTHSAQRYDQSQFENLKDFSSIAQKGSRKAGFEVELEHSLEDLMGMRQRIMRCQSKGACQRPQ